MFRKHHVLSLKLKWKFGWRDGQHGGYIDLTKIIISPTIDTPNHGLRCTTIFPPFHHLNIRWVWVLFSATAKCAQHSTLQFISFHFIFFPLLFFLSLCMLCGVLPHHELIDTKHWFLSHKYSLSVMFAQRNSLVIHLNESIYFDFPIFFFFFCRDVLHLCTIPTNWCHKSASHIATSFQSL